MSTLIFKKKGNSVDIDTSSVDFTKQQGEEITSTSTKFFKWMQTFSKKIVIIISAVFVLTDLFTIIMIVLQYSQTGDFNSIDTLITETHTTFRDIVGGYIVKSTTENVCKGICLIMDRYFAYKDKEKGVANSTVLDNNPYDTDNLLYHTDTDTTEDPGNGTDGIKLTYIDDNKDEEGSPEG